MNNISYYERTIKHAQQYEIDKLKLIDFYQLKNKKNYEYNVIQKKIFFGKENTINKIDKKKKYSDYLVFRQLLQKEYDIEDIKLELENTKETINYSKNLREEFYRYFKLTKDDIENTPQTQNYESNKIKENSNKEIKNDYCIDDFLKKCSLLKKKEKLIEEIENKTKFQIFSDLEKASDKYYASNININQLNLQYFEQKKKILKAYNREYEFVNFINKVKDGLIKTTPDTINTNIKDKFSSEIIDGLFDGRDSIYYSHIDSFFHKYKITYYKLKDEERDLYEHIYSILSKNNYMNFLSFLYSKNSLFRFIYNKFSDKDTTIENLTLEGMINENNLNNENKESKEIIDIPLGIMVNNKSYQIPNVPQIPERKKEIFNLIDGSFIFINCGYIKETMTQNDINKFFSFEKDENSSTENIDLTFGKCLMKATQVELNYLFIIDKNKRLKILNLIETFLDLNMEYVTFYKLNKSDLLAKLEKSLLIALYNRKKFTSNEPDNESIGNDYNYYIIEDKTENENKYYLIKILDKFYLTLENTLTKTFNLDSLDKIKIIEEEEKETSESKNETEEQNNESEEGKSEESKSEEKKNNNDSIIDLPSVKKVSKVPPLNLSKFNESASILNSSNLSSVSDSGVNKLIKEQNIKKIDNYETKNKKYEFDINGETYNFQIISDELRFTTSKRKSGKYNLKSLTINKPEYIEENSSYQIQIFNGKKLLFNIISEEKVKLDDFYYDLSNIS